MSKLSLIGLFICVLLLFSCSKESRNIHPERPSIPTIMGKNIDYSLNKNVHNDFYDFVDSIEIILLETKEQSIIGTVSDIHIIADKVLVTDMFKAKTIIVFDKDGKYLYSIGKTGKGKGEYQQMNSVNITEDYVDVCDLVGRKVCRYGNEGEFFKELVFPTDVYVSDFIEVNENSYILVYQTYEKSHPFRIEFTDSLFKVKNTAFPFTNTREFPVATISPMEQGHYSVYYDLCDTIYDMSESGITPLYTLGLYKNNEVNDYIDETATLNKKQFLKEWNSDKKDIIKNFYFYQMPNHLFAMYRFGSEIYYSIIDKSNNTVHTTFGQNTQQDECDIPFYFCNTYKDYILTAVTNVDLSRLSKDAEKTILSKMSTLDAKKWQRIKNNSDDNPSIFLFHLKNSK